MAWGTNPAIRFGLIVGVIASWSCLVRLASVRLADGPDWKTDIVVDIEVVAAVRASAAPAASAVKTYTVQ
jgi:hypothetical protein